MLNWMMMIFMALATGCYIYFYHALFNPIDYLVWIIIGIVMIISFDLNRTAIVSATLGVMMIYLGGQAYWMFFRHGHLGITSILTMLLIPVIFLVTYEFSHTIIKALQNK